MNKPQRQPDGSYIYRGLTIEKAGNYWVADDPETHGNVATCKTLADTVSHIDYALSAVQAVQEQQTRLDKRVVKTTAGLTIAANIVARFM